MNLSCRNQQYHICVEPTENASSLNAKYSMIVPQPSMVLIQLRIIRCNLSRTHYTNLSYIYSKQKKQQKLHVTTTNHQSEALAAVAYPLWADWFLDWVNA